MSTALDLTDLESLAALIRAAGVRSVTQDPAELNTPGVFIQATAVSAELLDGLVIRCQVICLAPDVPPARAAKLIQDLYNAVAPVLAPFGGPSGDAVFGKWVIAGSTTPLPGISIPLDLATD